TIPAGGDERILIVGADEPFTVAFDAIRARTPTFVVAQRVTENGERYRYAFRSEELIRLGTQLEPVRLQQSLEEAVRATPFEMHEGTSTPETSNDSIVGAPMNYGPTGQRLIVLDGGVVRAVVERGVTMPSTSDLVDVTRRAARTPAPPVVRRTRGGGGGGGRRPPAMRGAPAEPPETGADPEATITRVARERSMPVPAGPATPPHTLFIAGDMPESIPLDAVVPLNVTVSQQEIVIVAGPTRATATATVAPDRKVLVQVVPKRNLTVEGDDRAEIDPGAPRTDLVFDVKGAAAGDAEIWVLVRQGPVAVATLK